MPNIDQQPVQAVPRYVQAARASWMAPLVVVLMNVVVGTTNVREGSVTIAVGIIAGIIILAGLLFALWAITGALKKGPHRILFPATIGLLLNGFLLYVTYAAFQTVFQLAAQHRTRDAALASTDWIPTGDGWHIDRSAYFAIKFPAGWEVTSNPGSGVAAMALSPPESPEDTFRENISVASGRIPSGANSETYVANDLADMRKTVPGFKEHGSGTKTINGVEWSWIDYGQVIEGNDSRILGYMTVRHGRAFGIFCCAAPDKVQGFKPVFDEAVASIQIP